jgi:hypothetical protein
MTDKPLMAVLTGIRHGDWLAMSEYAGGPVRLGKVSDVTPKLVHFGYSKFYMTSGQTFQGRSPTASVRLSAQKKMAKCGRMLKPEWPHPILERQVNRHALSNGSNSWEAESGRVLHR